MLLLLPALKTGPDRVLSAVVGLHAVRLLKLTQAPKV